MRSLLYFAACPLLLPGCADRRPVAGAPATVETERADRPRERPADVAETGADAPPKDSTKPPPPRELATARAEFSTARLWRTGRLGPDAEIPTDRAQVLALCGDVLVRGAVRVAVLRAAHTRGDPGGYDVRGPCDTGFALFEDVRGLAPGPVKSVWRDPVALDGAPLELTPQVALRAQLRESGCEVLLDTGDVTWRLAHYDATDGGRPSLLWAGDLDGDGEIDLILDVSPKYSVSLLRLYLSGASDDSPVAIVAEHRDVID